jgi:hypothetical protein
MADFKQHMILHLRSAKVWMARAEESFDKNSNIRGELDLILAQAELQHARESNLSSKWRNKYPAIFHSFSLAAALVIVSVGYGSFAWNQHHGQTKETSPVFQSSTVAAVSQIVGGVLTSQPRVEAANEEPSVEKSTFHTTESLPVVVQQKIESVRAAEPSNLVPPGEMDKMIRVAGKSLRGQ